MTDTSPEALDALEKRLRSAHPNEDNANWCCEAAATIAALRAAPVAVRERAAALCETFAQRLRDEASKADEVGHDTSADMDRAGANVLAGMAIAIRALPLDAPGPVDPVAEAARQEKDGLSEAERQLRHALAQEARHD
jgi:hypothetical protein